MDIALHLSTLYLLHTIPTHILKPNNKIKSRDRNSCCATIGKRDIITTMIFPP